LSLEVFVEIFEQNIVPVDAEKAPSDYGEDEV
jgi:hypothetical protein